jgi:hypothetical protein
VNRSDKIKALQQMLQGEPINKVFPSFRVLIIEQFTATHSLLLGDIHKEIPSNQVNEYLKQLKQEHPFKRLDIGRISKEEYDRINEKLESEY